MNKRTPMKIRKKVSILEAADFIRSASGFSLAYECNGWKSNVASVGFLPTIFRFSGTRRIAKIRSNSISSRCNFYFERPHFQQVAQSLFAKKKATTESNRFHFLKAALSIMLDRFFKLIDPSKC